MEQPRRRNGLSFRPFAAVAAHDAHIDSANFTTSRWETSGMSVKMLSEPSSSLYWPPDVARYDMEALLFSSSGLLRTACIVSALFW